MPSLVDRARTAMWSAVAVLACSTALLHAQSNLQQLYEEAVSRETALRQEMDASDAGAPAASLLRSIRILVSSYEDFARLFPASEYGDNALWQGGLLAADAFLTFGEAEDRTNALRLLNALATDYPNSALVRQVPPYITKISSATGTVPREARPAASPSAERSSTTAPPAPRPERVAADAPANAPAAAAPSSPGGVATVRAIQRDVLPSVVRIAIEVDREVAFRDERLDGPPRVFVDLQNTQIVDALKDTTLSYADGIVRKIRTGRQAGTRIRVVLDLQEAGRHSVYTLYNPFRIVIDVERPNRAPALSATEPAPVAPPVPATVSPVTTPDAPPLPSPVPPRPNVGGGLSLSRQLGLGVSRIVIDPGHGGHDPGARVKGLTEAELVLDVALRLEKLLEKEPGVEVVLTRRHDEFVALQERTALANREEADLFLSIHVNASSDARIRGVETYFLNFARTKQAEAVAARENAASAQRISSLPEIVRAITLNDRRDESRDFASQLQTALLERLRRARKAARDLGVKQAPFQVLVGAQMPSALAEISFITNQQEQAWLKTGAYRQQLAEALYNGVMRYHGSLKRAQVAAAAP